MDFTNETPVWKTFLMSVLRMFVWFAEMSVMIGLFFFMLICILTLIGKLG